MNKVWIVTAGEYSDYHIERVFDSKQAADEYVKTMGTGYSDGGTVEEYPINHDFDREEIFWRVTYHRYGISVREGRSATRHNGLPKDATLREVVDDAARAKAKFGDGWGGRGYQQWSTWVQTDTEAKALKIGSDLLAEYLAREEGIA